MAANFYIVGALVFDGEVVSFDTTSLPSMGARLLYLYTNVRQLASERGLINMEHSLDVTEDNVIEHVRGLCEALDQRLLLSGFCTQDNELRFYNFDDVYEWLDGNPLPRGSVWRINYGDSIWVFVEYWNCSAESEDNSPEFEFPTMSRATDIVEMEDLLMVQFGVVIIDNRLDDVFCASAGSHNNIYFEKVPTEIPMLEEE